MFGSFKRFIQAWALVLAWQWPRAFQRSFIPSTHALTQEWHAQRRAKRQRRVRPPERQRPPPKKLPAKGGYRGTRALDARFSNQRLLRRMFRNS